MVHSGGTPHLHEPKLHERRFIYGYGLDGSEFPCHLMWPERVGSEQSVALLDSQANWWCKLTEEGYMCPLDLHHLMDAFRITAELSSAHLREIAVQDFPLGLAAPRFTVNLARFTKTRDCISCFGSTISGMRLFTKSWICIA